MTNRSARRRFLANVACAGAFAAVARGPAAISESFPNTPGFDSPLTDFHVHLDNSTIDKVLELPRAREVRFGIVEHAGTKENKYPVVLSNDDELGHFLAMLRDKPVYRGIQAEWTDWMGCFSKEALARLDFVLSDTMTFPAKDGQRVKLWEDNSLERVGLTDPEKFMDRYVDWHIEILERQPLDILANTTWLPAAFAPYYDRLWTHARMDKVIATAVKHRVALEISASFKLPSLTFLKTAKAAGAKFSFGSNGRYPNMGKLGYCLDMARQLGLKREDLFAPAVSGQKAVERRRWG